MRSTFTNVSAYNRYSDNSDAIPLLEGGTIDVTGEDNTPGKHRSSSGPNRR